MMRQGGEFAMIVIALRPRRQQVASGNPSTWYELSGANRKRYDETADCL
jgi:hypothetical protein